MGHQPRWIITSHTTQVQEKQKWLTNLYTQLQMGFILGTLHSKTISLAMSPILLCFFFPLFNI
jgi:hypothetical protein